MHNDETKENADDTNGDQRNSDRSNLKNEPSELTTDNSNVPSYAIIPLPSTNAQNNGSIFVSTQNIDEQSASRNAVMEILNQNDFNKELDYDIVNKTNGEPNRPTEITLLATENIILNNFTEHSIDTYDNNENYEKIFADVTNANVSQDQTTQYNSNSSAIDSNAPNENVEKLKSSTSINLEQKILQDGLQNTIAHISNGTEFTSDVRQYEDRSSVPEEIYTEGTNVGAASGENNNTPLYNHDSVTSHVSDIMSSSNEPQLFDASIENLSFINDTLRNGSLNAVDQTLDSSTFTNAHSEAIELAIASEEEIPSPWIDVVALATPPALRTESWSELNAFPTAVHSLVDLVGPEPYPLEIENQLQPLQHLENVNLVNSEDSPVSSERTLCEKNEKSTADSVKSKKGRNVLREITAEADICKCVDCKCDQMQNCQNCSSTEPENNKKDESVKTVSDFVPCLQSECSCNTEQGNCGSCCVVICLKTLQQLQKVFSRSCCKSTSSATCCREKLIPSLMKCQLTKNQ